MRDWTRGTISTRSLKRTRSTLPPVGAVVEVWVGRWVGDELPCDESKSIKCWASYILLLLLFFNYFFLKNKKTKEQEAEREEIESGVCWPECAWERVAENRREETWILNLVSSFGHGIFSVDCKLNAAFLNCPLPTFVFQKCSWWFFFA